MHIENFKDLIDNEVIQRQVHTQLSDHYGLSLEIKYKEQKEKNINNSDYISIDIKK